MNNNNNDLIEKPDTQIQTGIDASAQSVDAIRMVKEVEGAIIMAKKFPRKLRVTVQQVREFELTEGESSALHKLDAQNGTTEIKEEIINLFIKPILDKAHKNIQKTIIDWETV